MKDIGIKESFDNRFKTLGAKYFTADFENVNFNNNKAFTIPDNKQFFTVSLLTNEPEQIGVISDGKNERYDGFYQIDVCVPLDYGTEGINETVKDIYRLFSVGTTFDDVTVTGCYKASSRSEDTYYREIIRINFDADIIND